MQFGGHAPSLFGRLRRALQMAIPLAVAADTARSVVVTYNLAQQRFQEWEQEDNEATRAEMRTLLHTIAHRCAAQDKDFWPPGLALGGRPEASGGAASVAAGEAGEAVATAADIWQLLGLDGTAGQDSAAVLELRAAAGAESAAVEHQKQQQHASVALDAAAAAAGAQQQAQAQRGATHVVTVTLQEAVDHVAHSVASLQLPWSTLMAQQRPPAGVVCVTLSDVAAILATTRPVRAAAQGADALAAAALAAADAAADGLRGAVPLPQLMVSRRSALRCAVDWRGLHWPAGTPVEPLERELSCC